MKGIKLLCCTLAVLLLVPISAFAAEVPEKPVSFRLGGSEGEQLYGYDAKQMTLHPVINQTTADAAIKLWEALKPIAKAVPVKSAPIQAGLFARMKDGSKRLLYLTEGQAYEPDTKLVYETTAKQRAELLKTANNCATESVGGPLWLVYQSPEKITEIRYVGDENIKLDYEVTLNAKDHPREVLEVGRLLQEVRVLPNEPPEKTNGRVIPYGDPGDEYIFITYDTGVYYNLINSVFYNAFYASDLGYTLSYQLPKDGFLQISQRLKALSAQYGTVEIFHSASD